MKGKFSGEPKTIWLTEDGVDRRMKLVEPFIYTDRKGREWVAPADSCIDGATIPKALWTLLGSPYVGEYLRASIVHDVACDNARDESERRAADRMFFDAYRAAGCSRRDAMILYVGVRIGAWWRYGFLLQEESLEPRVVERPEDSELRKLYQATAEDVLQAGETDDPDELEARLDAAEPLLESRFLSSTGASLAGHGEAVRSGSAGEFNHQVRQS